MRDYNYKRDGFISEIKYRFGNFLADHSRGIYTTGAVVIGIAIVLGTALYASSQAKTPDIKPEQRILAPSLLENIEKDLEINE